MAACQWDNDAVREAIARGYVAGGRARFGE